MRYTTPMGRLAGGWVWAWAVWPAVGGYAGVEPRLTPVTVQGADVVLVGAVAEAVPSPDAETDAGRRTTYLRFRAERVLKGEHSPRRHYPCPAGSDPDGAAPAFGASDRFVVAYGPSLQPALRMFPASEENIRLAEGAVSKRTRPGAPVVARAEELRANVERFDLSLWCFGRGPAGKPFRALSVGLAPVLGHDRPNAAVLRAQLTREQALRVVDRLFADGFLDAAIDGDLRSSERRTYERPGYWLHVEGMEAEHRFLEECLGWNAGMLKRVGSLAEALEGDAAKAIGPLLARLDAYRPDFEAWEAGRNQDRLTDARSGLVFTLSEDGRRISARDVTGHEHWAVALHPSRYATGLVLHRGDLMVLPGHWIYSVADGRALGEANLMDR